MTSAGPSLAGGSPAARVPGRPFARIPARRRGCSLALKSRVPGRPGWHSAGCELVWLLGPRKGRVTRLRQVWVGWDSNRLPGKCSRAPTAGRLAFIHPAGCELVWLLGPRQEGPPGCPKFGWAGIRTSFPGNAGCLGITLQAAS